MHVLRQTREQAAKRADVNYELAQRLEHLSDSEEAPDTFQRLESTLSQPERQRGRSLGRKKQKSTCSRPPLQLAHQPSLGSPAPSGDFWNQRGSHQLPRKQIRASCRLTIQRLEVGQSRRNGMALSAYAFKRLAKEVLDLVQSPPEDIRISLPDYDDVLNFRAWVAGPVGTPYEGGFFSIRIVPTAEFPAAPPKCTFVTQCWHPNVNQSTGEICVSTLKKDWKSDYGIGHILQTIRCLLIAPNPESALNEEAGKMLLERYEDYTRHARLMTSIHASRMPIDLVKPFTVAPVASTSKLVDDKARSRSPSAVRGLSPEVSMAFPTMPLQASHSTNSINNDEGSQTGAGAGSSSGQSPGNSKKRTLSSAIGKPAAAPSEAPEAKKPATSNPTNKKRGLKRL